MEKSVHLLMKKVIAKKIAFFVAVICNRQNGRTGGSPHPGSAFNPSTPRPCPWRTMRGRSRGGAGSGMCGAGAHPLSQPAHHVSALESHPSSFARCGCCFHHHSVCEDGARPHVVAPLAHTPVPAGSRRTVLCFSMQTAQGAGDRALLCSARISSVSLNG